MPEAHHSKNFADASKRLPGFLVAWDSKLLLRFQTNPITMTISKGSTWANRNIPGWEGPIHWWSYGGAKSIKFDLAFDSTDAVRTGGVNLHGPVAPFFFGVQGVEAVLESFVYPQRSFDSLINIFGENSIPQSIKEIASGNQAFVPPPTLFFIFGLRVWKGHIANITMKEERFDRVLNPTHVGATVDFIVHEEGLLHKIDTGRRVGFALLTSASSTAQTVLNMLGVSGA